MYVICGLGAICLRRKLSTTNKPQRVLNAAICSLVFTASVLKANCPYLFIQGRRFTENDRCLRFFAIYMAHVELTQIASEAVTTLSTRRIRRWSSAKFSREIVKFFAESCREIWHFPGKTGCDWEMTDVAASAAHWRGVDDSKYLAPVITRVSDNGLSSVCAEVQRRDVLVFSVDPRLRRTFRTQFHKLFAICT